MTVIDEIYDGYGLIIIKIAFRYLKSTVAVSVMVFDHTLINFIGLQDCHIHVPWYLLLQGT